MDVVFLARIQFAANITFHILFPAISIALGWVLLFFRLKHLRAHRPAAEARLARRLPLLDQGIRAEHSRSGSSAASR